MNLNTLARTQPARYHSELRLFITSTSRDIGPERSALMNDVLPEFRKRSGERGVIVIDRDPRWEMTSDPGRTREIQADRMNELHGYRPLFIGILGAGKPAGASPSLPWLHDPGAGEHREVALDFIEQALENELMRGRALFYLLDPPEPGMDDELSGRIAALAGRLRDGGFPLREGIPDIAALGRHILNDLLGLLEGLYPLDSLLSPLEAMRRPHDLFAARLQRVYQEIGSHFNRLDAYLEDGETPLVVTGRSGDGKSSLFANWIAYRRKDHPGVPIIPHYIGAAVRTGHETVLRHLMAELKERYGISEPVPDAVEKLPPAFTRWLAQIGHEKIVIVIDGLDQLEEGARTLDWLPANIDIPPNVRLVVSVAHDAEEGAALLGRLIDRDWKEQRIEPLTLKDRQAIINRVVAETGSEMSTELLRGITLGGDGSSPLFIRMGAGQIRHLASERDRSDLLGAASGEEFLSRMFDQLEERSGRDVIGEIMALIWGARKGMSAPELLDLSGISSTLLDGFLASAGHYLVEQDGLWSFSHHRVRKSVERRYLPERGTQVAIHRRLARYFASGPATLRRADEEPWQWEQAGDRRELAECLSDIDLFLCLTREERRHELRGYWVGLNDESLMIDCYRRSFAAWCERRTKIEERAAVAERLWTFFTASGLLAAAGDYLRLALRLYRESLGDRDLATARTMHQLAELLRITGEFTEAERLYLDALAIREDTLPDDDPSIAQTLSDLGLLHRDAGELRSALPYYQRALDLKERIHGHDHPATAELLNDLALYYQDLHEFATAVPLYRRALTIRERRLGTMHPAVATTLNNMAGTLRDAGELDAAEEHYRRALDIRERMLGPNHPYTLITVGNLASILYLRKEFGDARTMFERAIRSTVKHLGEDHPNAIQLNIGYADLLRDLGEYVSAEAILRQTLAIATQTFGNLNWIVGVCYNNLAGLLRRMDREDETLPLYQGALDAWRASLGPEHPYVGIALHSLAIIKIKEHHLQGTGDMIAEAIAIREKHFGPDHELVMQTKDLLRRLHEAENAAS